MSLSIKISLLLIAFTCCYINAQDSKCHETTSFTRDLQQLEHLETHKFDLEGINLEMYEDYQIKAIPLLQTSFALL